MTYTSWEEDLRAAVQASLEAAGPKPDVRPVHRIEDDTWPLGALSLCERAQGPPRPPPHRWHYYTDNPHTVTCHDCLEWQHA